MHLLTFKALCVICILPQLLIHSYKMGLDEMEYIYMHLYTYILCIDKLQLQAKSDSLQSVRPKIKCSVYHGIITAEGEMERVSVSFSV